jgi:hypothetical protein
VRSIALAGSSQKSYPRCCGLIDNPLTHPARAACEASREARVGQPDPLASRARCGQGDRPSPHGMRETVCGISRFLKWPDRNPVLGLSRSGPVPRPKLRRPRRGTRPLRACWLAPTTPLRGAGRWPMLGASFLFAHGYSPAGSRPPCAFIDGATDSRSASRPVAHVCVVFLRTLFGAGDSACAEPAASAGVGPRSSHFRSSEAVRG